MADETLTRIQVRADGEYGSFYVLEGNEKRADGDIRYWCELTCNTSFGTVGYTWGNMGSPAAKFLSKVGRDYLLIKLWGTDHQVYDEEVARKGLVEIVLRNRRDGGWDREKARDAYDDIAASDLSSEGSYFAEVTSIRPVYAECLNGDPPSYKSDNPQALGFWKYLWPRFLAELAQRAEVATHG
ncbi:TPA: hypothetical protein UOA81_001902 [Stenotrophomonas maltophilia]|nr:hypothetical protein [Stenotrophomonas maltophilia]